MNRIAISGKMRSGKDTVAKYLVKKYGYEKYAFADEIKRLCANLFPELVIHGKPRWLYQEVGEFMCQIDPLVWVKKVERTLPLRGNVLISDVRKEVEYEFLKEKGFTVIKVEADEDVRWRRIWESGEVCTEADFNHVSEQQVDNIGYNYLIKNNGSREELYERIDNIMKRISPWEP